MDEQQLRKGLFQQIMGAGKGLANAFINVPMEAGSAAWNTAGMGKDFIEYNLAKNSQEKIKQAKEYTQKRTKANDALRGFGFDSDKKTGEQFDPKQYAKKTLQGAGQIASILSPTKGTFAQQFLVNATPGVTEAIGEGGNIGDIAMKGGTRGLMGAAMTKIVAPGIEKGLGKLGKAMKKSGEEMVLKGTKIPPSKITQFKTDTGEDLANFLLKRNLRGTGNEKVGDLIDISQSQFDDIARNSGRKFNVKDVKKVLTDKAKELKKSTFSEDIRLGTSLEDYAKRFGKKFKTGSSIDVADMTAERVAADKLTKKFATDPSAKGLNQVIRDNLQKNIQEGTNDLTINGKSLKDIGVELSKLYKYQKLAEKAGDVGKGNLPIGLLPTITGSIGLGGSIAGGERDPAKLALNTALLTAPTYLLNKPAVFNKVIQGLIKGGEKVSTATVNNSGKKALQLLGQRIGNKTVDSLFPQDSSFLPETPNDQIQNNGSENKKNQLYATQSDEMQKEINQDKNPNEPSNIHSKNMPQGLADVNSMQFDNNGQQTLPDVNNMQFGDQSASQPQLIEFKAADGNTYKKDEKTGDIYSSQGQWKWDDKTNDWVPSNLGGQVQGAQSPLGVGANGITKEMFQQAMIRDLQTTGGQRIPELKAVYEQLFPQQDPADFAKAVKENRDVEINLRKEFNDSTEKSNFNKIRENYQRIKGTSATGPGDLSLIFSYMKLLDPASVVRESEFSNAQDAMGYVQKQFNVPAQLMSGTRLTEEGRKWFKREAAIVYNDYVKRQKQLASEYGSYANDYGVDPNRVIGASIRNLKEEKVEEGPQFQQQQKKQGLGAVGEFLFRN